jgi:excisionase family DNA binding protein
MIIVETKHKLLTLDTDDYVYVKGTGRIYIKEDGEWIGKLYFTVIEAAEILGVNKSTVYNRMEDKKYMFRRQRVRGKGVKLTFAQLQTLMR